MIQQEAPVREHTQIARVKEIQKKSLSTRWADLICKDDKESGRNSLYVSRPRLVG